MGNLLQILAPFVALATIFFTTEITIAAAKYIRRSEYRRFEDRCRGTLERQFPVPAPAGSAIEVFQQQFGLLLNEVHRRAGSAQTTYHNAVVRSAAGLATAFVALALQILWKEQPAFGPHPAVPTVELVLSWMDAFSLILVLALFFFGRASNRPWVRIRVKAELLRQHQFLAPLFPSIVRSQLEDVDAVFHEEERSIVSKVEKGAFGSIAERTEKFWSKTATTIRSQELREGDLTMDALLVYLSKRVRRQLGWFIDSHDRLESIGQRRQVILAALYAATAGLAVTEHIFILLGQSAPYFILPLVLMLTGLSAAMTASYVNANSRSLLHRYNFQQREIKRWLGTFDAIAPLTTLNTHSLDVVARSRLREQILEFENLMIEELIDWINISTHDVIELS